MKNEKNEKLAALRLATLDALREHHEAELVYCALQALGELASARRDEENGVKFDNHDKHFLKLTADAISAMSLATAKLTIVTKGEAFFMTDASVDFKGVNLGDND
jgi:hypothetical protein